MNALSLYESMSELSAGMVAAARRNDWDRLAALERGVARMRDTLAAGEARQPTLSAEERGRKLALIHRMLDDDAEIRRHTEPWMENVRAYLASASRSHQVGRAYGSMSGR